MLLLAVTIQSHRVFAQSVTITLMPGWNWISVPMMDTLDFETALGSFTPAVGDMIKSQWSNASYRADGHWRGQISQFYPGYGYKYYSNRTMPVMVTFTAQEPAPQVIVTTMEPTDITINSAICGGNVSSNDAFVILKGICWSTNQNPTFNDNYVGGGNGIGSFIVSMTGLTIGTTYYVRAFAVTATGIFYGNEVSFTVDHAYIDLGLPSGTLWATCNVGADAPEDYGDYFAWGETQPKDTYNWYTYQYCNGSNNTLTKYCSDSNYGNNGFTDNLITLLPEDDAATANWGEDWRMPTKEEWQELYNNTTVTWTAQNGVNGRLFTAPNGNTLFLPTAGYFYSYSYGSSFHHAGEIGLYWSSSLWAVNPEHAWRFYMDSGNYSVGNSGRDSGQSIRAVRSSE